MTRDAIALKILCATVSHEGAMVSHSGDRQVRTAFALAALFRKIAEESPVKPTTDEAVS